MFLQPGQTATVRFTLDARSFSTWDTSLHRWVAAPGTFTIRAGDSSRDLPLVASLQLTSRLTPGAPTPPAPNITTDPLAVQMREHLMCLKDFIAPNVNAVLSITGFPPLEVLGRPVP